MKNLILIRHAKSSWEYNLPDIERPLDSRGKNDAPLVAKAFSKTNPTLPDAIYCSPATRTKMTCELFLENLYLDYSTVQIINDLYDFHGTSAYAFIKTLNNDISTVYLFGHNHALTTIANLLGDLSIENIPTSGLVNLQLPIPQWANIKSGIIQNFLYPKLYK